MNANVREVKALGNRILYYDRGSGPVLVLLHGMFGDYLDWEPVLEPLAEDSRVIAPDLPGFGDSEKPDVDYSPEFFVETVADFLRQLGVTKCSLIGNSFGGSISILYTLAHPAQVERLVLVSSGGMRRYGPDEVEQVNRRFTEANIRALTPAVQEMMLAPIFARKLPQRDRYLAKQSAKIGRVEFPQYARSLSRAARTAFPLYLRDRLAEVQSPTLLVWGDADVVFPLELARAALEQLRAGKLAVLHGCGHIPQLDDPERFVAAVREFLTIQAPARSAS